MTDVSKLARCTAPVLITGETGAGKEVAALAIHHATAAAMSRKGEFVAVNCAALPDTLAESELFGHVRGAFTGADVARTGAFVQAAGGTLFLDEIGDAPRLLQAKLLRALDSGSVTPVGSSKPVQVSARIVCATNVDLAAAVAAGAFRADLLYRVDVLRLRVPSLRERGDFASTVYSVLARVNGELGTRCVIDDPNALKAYAWPGNVRELKNAITRACAEAQSGPIAVKMPVCQTDVLPLAGTLDDVVTARILAAIKANGSNNAAAARELGINRTTLVEWRRRYKEEGVSKIHPGRYAMVHA